jgi:hypothetical protein
MRGQSSRERSVVNITAVQSATLAAIGYDSTLGILQLEFRSRAVYRYCGVPGGVYDALRAAPPKGRYFNLAIRGRYPHSLVPGAESGGLGER